MNDPDPLSSPVWFHSKDPATGWLSNFSPHPFTLDGVRWPSVEHCYQALKYPDPAVAARIRAAESAARARKLGQDRSLAVRPDWAERRLAVMALALRAKFEQNRALGVRLLATGAAPLIHLSASDHFWGRSRDGEGENRLGELLMALRREMAALPPRGKARR
ncbi:MAG: NADAR family protein [Dongiaceae bacterium]